MNIHLTLYRLEVKRIKFFIKTLIDHLKINQNHKTTVQSQFNINFLNCIINKTINIIKYFHNKKGHITF